MGPKNPSDISTEDMIRVTEELVRRAHNDAMATRARSNRLAEQATEKERKERILREHLRELRGEQEPEAPKLEAVPNPGVDTPDFARIDFQRMKRLHAIEHILRREHRLMGSAEVHELMIAGGRTDPIKYVRNCMTELSNRGRAVKLGMNQWTVPEYERELAPYVKGKRAVDDLLAVHGEKIL